MSAKISIILAVLAVLAPCYLSAPRPSRDSAGSCGDGQSTLTCSPVVSLMPALENNLELWGTMCGSLVVQQLAKGVCYELSEAAAKSECCTNFPRLNDTKDQKDGELVFKLTTGVVVGRGVVQLGQQVCEAERVKFVQGCPNGYEECRKILVRVEELQLNVTKAVSSQPASISVNENVVDTRAYSQHSSIYCRRTCVIEQQDIGILDSLLKVTVESPKCLKYC